MSTSVVGSGSASGSVPSRFRKPASIHPPPPSMPAPPLPSSVSSRVRSRPSLTDSDKVLDAAWSKVLDRRQEFKKRYDRMKQELADATSVIENRNRTKTTSMDSTLLLKSQPSLAPFSAADAARYSSNQYRVSGNNSSTEDVNRSSSSRLLEPRNSAIIYRQHFNRPAEVSGRLRLEDRTTSMKELPTTKPPEKKYSNAHPLKPAFSVRDVNETQLGSRWESSGSKTKDRHTRIQPDFRPPRPTQMGKQGLETALSESLVELPSAAEACRHLRQRAGKAQHHPMKLEMSSLAREAVRARLCFPQSGVDRVEEESFQLFRDRAFLEALTSRPKAWLSGPCRTVAICQQHSFLTRGENIIASVNQQMQANGIVDSAGNPVAMISAINFWLCPLEIPQASPQEAPAYQLLNDLPAACDVAVPLDQPIVELSEATAEDRKNSIFEERDSIREESVPPRTRSATCSSESTDSAVVIDDHLASIALKATSSDNAADSRNQSDDDDDDEGSDWEYYDDENSEKAAPAPKKAAPTLPSIPAGLLVRFNWAFNDQHQESEEEDESDEEPDEMSPYNSSPYLSPAILKPWLATSISEWCEAMSKLEAGSRFHEACETFHKELRLCAEIKQPDETEQKEHRKKKTGKSKLDKKSSGKTGSTKKECKPEVPPAPDLEEGLLREFGEENRSFSEYSYCNGVKHGLYRHFNASVKAAKEFSALGTYHHGSKTGVEWRRMNGGSYLILHDASQVIDENNNGDAAVDANAVYLYPDLMHAIEGKFTGDGKLISGRYGVVSALNSRGRLLLPVVDLIEGGDEFTYDPSTSVRISKTPFLRDPFEHEQVYVSCSRIPYAGEGLFAKKSIAEGGLVALFNGVKMRDVTGRTKTAFTDYKIALTGDVCLDIPRGKENLSTYTATLGHKACHSFTPNAGFCELHHPRFGSIMSVVAKRDIARGEEVLVSYNYSIHLAPDWYRDLFFVHLRCTERWSEADIYQWAKRRARESGGHVPVPPPDPLSDRFVPCGLCSGHVAYDAFSVCCESCATSFHGKCFDAEEQERIRASAEEGIELWYCDTCTNN